MNEDKGGTAGIDPDFGKTGRPADLLLSKSPVAGFDFIGTNDTIRNDGRYHPLPCRHPFHTVFRLTDTRTSNVR